jgi:hypothetical protein
MKHRKKWDVFICHASEDKGEIADPLANKLTSLGIKVWYDRFQLKWGNRLMKQIDRGLVNSKYGIVILSCSFFDKHWPESELEALFSLMRSEPERDLLLPLLHKVKYITFKDLKKRVSLDTTQQQSKLFERLLNKPFWIWDQHQHKLEDVKTNGDCCFNHIISLPQKDGMDKPLYDYQKILYDALFR